MKNIIAILILGMGLSSTASAAMTCSDYFLILEKDLTKTSAVGMTETMTDQISDIIDQSSLVLDEVRALRKKINFWRNMTGDSGRKALHDLRMHKKHFVFLFKNAQDATVAIEQYRDAFLDVELGWFRMNQVQFKKRKSLESENPELAGKVDEIQAEKILEVKKRFAKNYADYTYIRAILERIASGKLNAKEAEELANVEGEADAAKVQAALNTAAQNARYVLDSLGTASFISDQTAQVIKRPTLAQIHSYFRLNPELLILKLKSDLNLQRIYALRMIPITLTQVETVQSLILKVVPERYRAIVGGFIGLNYNSFVLKRYLQDIETVIETPDNTPFQRLEVLRVISSNKNTDEFLTTFARLTLYTKQWVDLKKQAEKKQDEPIYEKFYQQMLTAEQKAVKADSWLTPFYKPSFIDHVRVWLGPAAAVAASQYFNFNEATGGNAGVPSGVWSVLKSALPFFWWDI